MEVLQFNLRWGTLCAVANDSLSCCCMADVEVELTDAEFHVLEGDLHAPVCASLRGATEKSVVVNATTSPGTAGTHTHTPTHT